MHVKTIFEVQYQHRNTYYIIVVLIIWLKYDIFNLFADKVFILKIFKTNHLKRSC